MKFAKNLFSSVSTVAAVLLLTSSAQAAVMTPVTDTVTANPDKTVSVSETVNYEHIFTDQGFVLGVTKYVAGLFTLRLTDAQAGENGVVRLGTQTQAVTAIDNNSRDQDAPEGSFYSVILNQSSLDDLNADGRIAVQITASNGVFYFADSSLQLTPSEVPEPMSLAILGAGLLGMGAIRRRRAAK